MKYDLYLRGYVGGPDFDAALVSRVLEKHKGEHVSVLIDSLGGSLATALSIAASFREHGNVTVHFVGMNASAATIASMGAKEITIDACAMYLVHKCSAEFFQWASLNADQLQEQIDQLAQMKSDLEKIDLNVAQMYARKCKKPVADLLALMKTGGWLTAEEAMQWGFVDSITDNSEDVAPVLTAQIAASMQANGMPVPDMQIQTEVASKGLHKLVEMLSSFFQRKDTKAQTNQPEKITAMKKLFPLLAVALALQQQEFEMENDALSLTAEQADRLEAHLKTLTDQIAAQTKTIADKDSRIADLEKQLKEKPAAETQQVINNNGGSDDSPEAQFMANLNAAQQLFDQLP